MMHYLWVNESEESVFLPPDRTINGDPVMSFYYISPIPKGIPDSDALFQVHLEPLMLWDKSLIPIPVNPLIPFWFRFQPQNLDSGSDSILSIPCYFKDKGVTRFKIHDSDSKTKLSDSGSDSSTFWFPWFRFRFQQNTQWFWNQNWASLIPEGYSSRISLP